MARAMCNPIHFLRCIFDVMEMCQVKTYQRLCILLLMASRWVQDGFNIGFGCCTWLIDRCKIHRKKWYGFDIALDGFKMGSRWVQDGFKMGSRWLLDDQSGTATIEADDKNFIVRPLMANLVQSSQYCCSHCRASAYSALDCLPR